MVLSLLWQEKGSTLLFLFFFTLVCYTFLKISGDLSNWELFVN